MVGYVRCNQLPPLRILQEVKADVRLNCTPDDLYSHIQSHHLQYTILLISNAELPELYILTKSGIKADKKAL